MRNIILCCVVFVLLAPCSAVRFTPDQRAVADRHVVQEVRQAVESGKLTVRMDYVTPFRAGIKHLSSGYDVRLSGDTLYSYLPYFGRAYSVPYGGGKGLMFDAPVQDCAVDYPKKGLTRLHVVVRNDEDQYMYVFDVFDNGHVDLLVTSNRRERISFSGELLMTGEDAK